MLPPPPPLPIVVHPPVDLRGEIQELYFYKPVVLGVSIRTLIVMKVRVVNHGPDEATVTHVGLHVGLEGFQQDCAITNIPDSFRIKRRREGDFDLILPSYQETTIAPILGGQAHKEIYKKGLPHEGWLAFECYSLQDVEFPNARFDLHLKDSLGGTHCISRKSMVYIRDAELVVASSPALPAPPSK